MCLCEHFFAAMPPIPPQVRPLFVHQATLDLRMKVMEAAAAAGRQGEYIF